jgi:ATP-dependent Lon protease
MRDAIAARAISSALTRRFEADPVLPLRDIVVFPHMIVPLFVGREKSVRALEEVMQDDKQILLSSQIDPAVDDPDRRRHLPAGVLANVLQLLKLPDGTVKVLVEGQRACASTEFSTNDHSSRPACRHELDRRCRATPPRSRR